MTWLERYGKDTEPTMAQISSYIDNPLWESLHAYMREAYQTEPKRAFSGCSGQPGWNVKYQKGGRSLCTLYPMEGYFIALIVIGEKERTEAELQLPTFTPYVRQLYAGAAGLAGAKWLMTSVTDEDILSDAKRLIALRRPPREKRGA